jgi:hypothetical protein
MIRTFCAATRSAFRRGARVDRFLKDCWAAVCVIPKAGAFQLLVLSACGLSLAAQTPATDQVIMNNGDHFTGRVVSETPDSVALETEDAGTIMIRRGGIKQIIIAPKPTQTVARSSSASCLNGTKPVPSSWLVGVLGTPDKVVLGTQSQEQFGAELGLNFCEGSQNNTTNITAKGSHSRTYKENSTAIQTDIAGAQFEQQHFFNNPQGAAVYGIVEIFTNNSLGMAMQKSFGIGLLSPQYKINHVFYDFAVDTRYVNEHLDHTPLHLDLSAIRVKEQVHYQGKQFSFNQQAWMMPTLNDVHALQFYASLGPALTIKPWLKLGLTEEESYLGNAPRPNRKNYFASTLSLTLQGGSGSRSK